MADLNVPSVFTSGTSIVAADMNANFDAIETKLNSTGVHVYEAASIETAALENNAVTHAKMDSKTQGQQAGYAQAVAQYTGPGNALSVTVTGDGATPVKLKAEGLGICCTSDLTAAQNLEARLLDGVTVLFGTRVSGVGTDSRNPLAMEWTVPAFTGSKTFHLSLPATAVGSPYITASATYPFYLRATWAPGYSTS